MDFVSDTLESGRSIRMLTVADACSRLSPAIEVETSLSGERVARVLDRAAEMPGLPKKIVVDNGPEFTSRATAGAPSVRSGFIRFQSAHSPRGLPLAVEPGGRMIWDCAWTNCLGMRPGLVRISRPAPR